MFTPFCQYSVPKINGVHHKIHRNWSIPRHYSDNPTFKACFFSLDRQYQEGQYMLKLRVQRSSTAAQNSRKEITPEMNSRSRPFLLLGAKSAFFFPPAPRSAGNKFPLALGGIHSAGAGFLGVITCKEYFDLLSKRRSV
jgi:hypothetical protein